MHPTEKPQAPPALTTDRRSILAAGLFGMAGLPAAANASAFQRARGFTHNVASGEPAANSVLLWTRFRPASGEPAMLRFEVSDAIDFARVVSSGEVEASPDRDWCVKAIASGLSPNRWYYFRFIAPDGAMSPFGRTRTLPQGGIDKWRMAVFACSNLGFGWFNAYAHAAEAGDFDCVLHTGDYIYEYPQGTYPSPSQTQNGRVLDPAHEIVALADYRMRYAAYRSDPDLQRIHQLFPMIPVPDDHEFTNDPWKDGAQNHQPETEGSWEVRKATALRVYREWMPISDALWESYQIGDLVTLFRIETRITARDKQFSYSELLSGLEPGPEWDAKLSAFRDGKWRDASRTLLGSEQESWLSGGMAASVRSGRKWQVLLQQVIMAELYADPSLAENIPAEASEFISSRLRNRALVANQGLPLNMDAWDGYPAARERLLNSARDADANLVVLTGDTHNAWASELGGAGIEFAGQSVTSPGMENSLGWIPPDQLARSLVSNSEQLKWVNTHQRGYMVLELTPQRATSEWRFMETIRQRTTTLAGTHRVSSELGSQRLTV
ncbi:alkaline phosphatase D family protein [Altererythrobacter sp. MF3-039]|uniref:alkaline phosphatase D family protein n=1 Tax=Altererythrobacter sp. MF3-039 TaxID=3252901 RepID=UPI00390C54F6